MPELLSLALFERGGRLMVVKRKDGHQPFAGAWLLPAAVVGSEESAEEALERHAHRELGVELGELEFAETLYLEDPSIRQRYVANIFKVLDHDGELRFRADGDYDDARWLSGDELAGVGIAPALLDWLQAGRHEVAPPSPVPAPAGGATPDNRQGWNAISRAYQEPYQISTDSLLYGP
ncbi:MAG: NUDIX hydrolase, partial [Chloroflexi bacterium]|nr:NUDIX hydrolase [Chloroflexota bacterium]